MSTISKKLKYTDELGVERELCPTVCDEHVLVGDGSKTLKEELASIKRRLSSSPAAAVYELQQQESPFQWNKGVTKDGIQVTLSTQEAKISNVKLKVNALSQSFRATNLLYGKNFFDKDDDGNGIPDEWAPHTHGLIYDGKPNRGVVSIKNGKLLLDASQATTMSNQLGVSIPISHLVKKGHQYVAVIKTGMAQPSSTMIRVQYYGMTKDDICLSSGGTDLGSREESVFYFDPFSKWFEQYPSQPIEAESFKLDIFIRGTGKAYIEQVALYELPSDFYGTPDFSSFDSTSKSIVWDRPIEMPMGVRLVSVSPKEEQYETRVLFTEPINPNAVIPDVVNISEAKLYRYVDENGDALVRPITFPIQVEGDKIEDHWGVCDLSHLEYVDELRSSSKLVRYELMPLQGEEPWFETDEKTYFDARYYQKRILCSQDSKLGVQVEYEYTAASHSQRLEASYLQLLKHEMVMDEVAELAKENALLAQETKQAIETVTSEVDRLGELVKDLDLDSINEVKQDIREVTEQIEEIQAEMDEMQSEMDEMQSEMDQPISESDVDDIIEIIKGE